MNKPNEFEQTQGGDFTPVELGGHLGIIKNVKEQTTKNGDPMIVVSIDFDKNDKQPGYFMDMFRNDIRPDKKYPNQATNYIMSEYQGKCTRGFKSFVTSFARSNGIDVDKGIKWGDGFCEQFKNKKIGVVFGNVEELYNGEIKTRRKIRWFCEYDKATSQSIPKDVVIDDGNKGASSAPTNPDGFMEVSGSEEEVPF